MTEWQNGRTVEWRTEWSNGGNGGNGAMADGMVKWQEWRDGGWNGQMAGMAGMVEWQKEWQNGRMAEWQNGRKCRMVEWLLRVVILEAEWQNDRTVEWQNGGMANRMVEWRTEWSHGGNGGNGGMADGMHHRPAGILGFLNSLFCSRHHKQKYHTRKISS